MFCLALGTSQYPLRFKKPVLEMLSLLEEAPVNFGRR